MPIKGTDHIVILVANMEEAVGNWSRMGMALTHRVTHERAGIHQAFFSLSDNTFIELIAPCGEASPLTDIINSKGEGIHLLALETDDWDSTLESLEQQGVELHGRDTPQVVLHPRSTHGVRIQLWPDDRPHRWKENPSEAGN